VAHLAALPPEADLVGLLAGHGDEAVVALVITVDHLFLLSLPPIDAMTPHELDELGRFVLLLVLQLEARNPIHHLRTIHTPRQMVNHDATPQSR
jgi:hypothetical protein